MIDALGLTSVAKHQNNTSMKYTRSSHYQFFMLKCEIQKYFLIIVWGLVFELFSVLI